MKLPKLQNGEGDSWETPCVDFQIVRKTMTGVAVMTRKEK